MVYYFAFKIFSFIFWGENFAGLCCFPGRFLVLENILHYQCYRCFLSAFERKVYHGICTSQLQMQTSPANIILSFQNFLQILMFQGLNFCTIISGALETLTNYSFGSINKSQVRTSLSQNMQNYPPGGNRASGRTLLSQKIR